MRRTACAPARSSKSELLGRPARHGAARRSGRHRPLPAFRNIKDHRKNTTKGKRAKSERSQKPLLWIETSFLHRNRL